MFDCIVRTEAEVPRVCVLLVEDEPIIREIMAESLQDAGFEVHEVESGERAVEAIAGTARHYTMLVTDYHMPGGANGLDVALSMRRVLPDIPVVIASGRPDVFQAAWSHEHSYVLLRKPYLASELVGLVRDLLSAAGANTK